MRAQPASLAISIAAAERPRLELSGPKLARAFETLVSGSEEHGGIERYVVALRAKSALFREALGDGRAGGVDAATFRTLCAHLATVRRRVGPHLEAAPFAELRARMARLLEGSEDATRADARIAQFCDGFGAETAKGRWVRDLAAEILHNVDPERYPLMCRWVWDAGTDTGVLREIWHAADPDRIVIGIPDGHATFVMLREELAQFLSANGVFRDPLQYVDLLTAQAYAGYICEHGGAYLRTDFATPEDPLLHTRRLLGLEGVDGSGRSRLKAADGTAVVVDETKRIA